MVGPLAAAAAAALASCGSSGPGLIPVANAGPLQSDFEAVAQAAQNGNGNCNSTVAAINKTEQDFASLPTTIDPGLHRKLSQGISNLRERALAACAQPLVQTNTTPRTTTAKTEPTTTPTTTTPTTTTPTSTATTPTTAAPTPNNGGGTAAPGESESEAEPGNSKEHGNGHDNGHGHGDESGESGGVGPGGPE